MSKIELLRSEKFWSSVELFGKQFMWLNIATAIIVALIFESYFAIVFIPSIVLGLLLDAHAHSMAIDCAAKLAGLAAAELARS